MKFDFEWLDDAPEGAAFGPECDTWCRLIITLDDNIITQNHPADHWSVAGERNFVTGPMSGIVEWLVENWPYILWDTHCPFGKSPLPGHRRCIPTLRDADSLWANIDTSHGYKELARWQHRHTIGHGASDLALPSLVVLPEDKRIGFVLEHVPPRLGPTVRFTPPNNSQWPTEPTWVGREDVHQEFARVVEATLIRAASRSSGEWAEFTRARWNEMQARVEDANQRRELILGTFMGEQWSVIDKTFGADAPGIESLLFDAEQVISNAEFDTILTLSSPVKSSIWSLPQEWIFGPGAPHEQGYELATRAREFLGNTTEPIIDFSATLTRFGVEVRDLSTSSFASAIFARADGPGILAVSTQQSRGVAPTRFAIAAALGRFLAERIAGKPFGAAHSGQSRWLATQRANAFAAEFLLPASAIGMSVISDLCDSYGISRSAATWHVQNRGTLSIN